ncbi:hypothetical protein [Amycolatopsis pithecellobii]|uniref:hypothetical protein n=1 Tax=Amycolatopsis pithecellobii TaxID=664692 RepID=UPI001FE65088|nr:hypothetical protein [Amycolatopsis pithecellobii]
MTPSPTTQAVVGLGALAEAQIVARVAQPGYRWWLAHVMPAAACSRPVRLRLEATWATA